MRELNIIWQKGAITVESLPGDKSFLFRFHKEGSREILSSCVVAEVDELEGEVKAWGGRRGPTTLDRRAIAEFCQHIGLESVYWRRYKDGNEPYKTWLYKKENKIWTQ